MRRSARLAASRFACLALLWGGATAGQAQSDRAVTGRVLDASTQAPLGFASVVVEAEDGRETLAAGLAEEDGRFLIRGLASGRVRVWIVVDGYRRAEVSALIGELSEIFDLGDIALERAEFEERITVTGEAVRAAGVDSRVFRLDDGAGQSTGSLLDAMKNLPGVTVDQEGRVFLRGSDQVSVLIEGRPSSLTGFGSQRGLDSVSAANIESIEIIHNPSARFEAAGAAGIINILYKEERDLGLSGDAGLTLANGQFSRQRADLPTELGSYANNEKIIPSLNLNYNTEAVRSFMQAELLIQDDLPNNEFTTRFYDDGRVIESQVPENREQEHYILRAGADWNPRPRSTFSTSVVYDFETHTDRAQVPFLTRSTGERERYWFWREEEDTGFANLSLGYEHRFATPGHELAVRLEYTRGWEDESYFLNEESAVRIGTDMTRLDAEENTLPLSVDYVRPLRHGRLELGAKLQSRWIPISYTVERGEQSVIYEGLGDFSDWEEDLVALYGNLVLETERASFEVGVRGEHVTVEYTIPEDNIYYPGSDRYDDLELFPNLRATWKLSPANRVSFAYNRRIDRPGEPELRIFPKYDDPELLKVGNPFLRPQLTDALEIGFRRAMDRGSWSAAAYLRDTEDAFLRVFAVDDSDPDYDIVNKIFQNAGNSTQTGLEFLFDFQVTEIWSLSASWNGFRREIEAFETTLLFPTVRPFSLAASDDEAWDAKLSQRVQLAGGTTMQLSWLRYSSRNVPQGHERARSSLDLTFKQPLRGEKVELQVTFTDMLNDFAIEREIDGNGFTALYQNYFETQVLSIGLRYRFD